MPGETPTNASEVAQWVATLIRDPEIVPRHAVADLRRLLGHGLAEPPAAARRWDSLWLLVALIAKREGLLPTTTEYEKARREHEAEAPAASSLVKRYGHWLAALKAAGRLMQLRPAGPAWSERQRYRRPYRPREGLVAIACFYHTFDVWPSREEYNEWSGISRRAARSCGAPDPRLPSATAVVRLYGTFDRALEAAKAMYGDAG
jgi:hypothetical protein